MIQKLRFYCLVIVISVLVTFPNHASAATDPISATASATATVPSTTATTSDTTAPTVPILIYPTDGHTTNTTRPEFSWKMSNDPNGNTVYYTLYLNGVAKHLGISNIGNSQGNNYISRIGDNNVYLNPIFDLTEGEYDWYVVAYDLSNNKSYSTTWHFTIDTTAPVLTLTNLDGTYPDPDLTVVDPKFEIVGPKDVTFYLRTEPWATISLKVTGIGSNFIHSSSHPTGSSGLTYPYTHLAIGSYYVDISSFDHAGITSTLPTFTLVITESKSDSSTTPASPSTIYLLPSNITHLPSTIYNISTRFSLTFYLYILLAFIICTLLVLLWYRRSNILILDKASGKPIRSAIVYHSRPTTKLRYTNILATRRPPVLYELYRNNHGLLHISRLSRYSTLTIRVGETTHLLSLSTSKSFYTILI